MRSKTNPNANTGINSFINGKLKQNTDDFKSTIRDGDSSALKTTYNVNTAYSAFSAKCAVLGSMFSFQPNNLRHILKFMS